MNLQVVRDPITSCRDVEIYQNGSSCLGTSFFGSSLPSESRLSLGLKRQAVKGLGFRVFLDYIGFRVSGVYSRLDYIGFRV